MATSVPIAVGEIVGVDWLNAVAHAKWRKTTAKTVNNTVTETDLLNGEVTIDAGAVSTNRMLRMVAWGDLLNNTGATQHLPRFKLGLGATTLLDTGSDGGVIGWLADTARRPWKIEAEVLNLGAANSQWATIRGEIYLDSSASNHVAFTTGEGQYESGTASRHVSFLGANSAAVDTTAAVALVLSVILPTASANLEMKLHGATVEVV